MSTDSKSWSVLHFSELYNGLAFEHGDKILALISGLIRLLLGRDHALTVGACFAETQQDVQSSATFEPSPHGKSFLQTVYVIRSITVFLNK